MNYEELIESRAAKKDLGIRLPIGLYNRRQVEGKYYNIIDIDCELNNNVKFAEGLKAECARNAELKHKNLMHFDTQQRDGEIKVLRLESGNYQTLEQLLHDHPAIVADRKFVDSLISQLLDVTEYLHGQNVWHVCYAPRNIFVRKGDNAPLLLTHGSFYMGMSERMLLYKGMEDFVAPEVSNGSDVDGRCDFYSLGKLMEWLFQMGDMPYEYKKVMQRCLCEKPEERYQTADELRKALRTKRETRKSVLALVAAVVIALLLIGLYFELMPETVNVDYVKPAPRQTTDDLLEDGFDPAELGVVSGDTLIMTAEERRNQAEYEAKAEQIFRKRYTAEADRVLSKIYNNEHMSSSEKQFMSQMSSVNEELLRLQEELGSEAGLSSARSQLIASEIVETLTEQKKKGLKYYGVQK